MYCRSFFSHKDLENKNRIDMHEMLYKISKNWSTDLNNQQKNGTFLIKSESGIIQKHDVIVDYSSFNKILKDINVLSDILY